MRVLLVSTFFPPQHAVASQRAWSFAHAWAEAGEEVTVLTVPKRPDQCGDARAATEFNVVAVPYPVPKPLEWLRRFEKDAPTTEDDVSGRAANRTRSGMTLTLARRCQQRTGIFSAVRMPDLTDFWVKPAVHWAQSQQPWDVVYSTSGPYTTHLVAHRLRVSGHARTWIAEFRDLWTKNHSFRGLFPFTLRERALERRMLSRADMVVTISPALADQLSQHTSSPVEVVYNGYESIDRSELPADRMFPLHGEAENTINLVFTGTHYPPMQDPLPLLRAIKLLQQHDSAVAARLRLHIAGFSSEKWRDTAEAVGVSDSIHIHGLVDKRTARQMQRDADALVFLDWNGPQDGILTTKIFEYIASPPPILVVGENESSCAAKLLNRAGGSCFVGSNPSRIASVLHDLVDDPSGIHTDRDDQIVGSFSREAQSKRSLELLRHVAESASSR